MNGAITDEARALAAQLERQFGRDAELAKRLANAQRRLERANDRLWKGLHPDGLARVYGQHPAVGGHGVRRDSLGSARRGRPARGSPTRALERQEAFIDYQSAAQERRQLDADTGETIRHFVNELVATGWSEEQARSTNVHELPATTKQPTTTRS
jgi:hypothetical protein